VQAPFENIRHLGKFSMAIFLVYLESLYYRIAFFGFEKVEFGVGTTHLKKSRFFFKNDVIFEKSSILDF
jgi:hypothetical protein